MRTASVLVAASPEWLSFINAVHHLPLMTTVLCVVFSIQLFGRYYRRRSGVHLLWWGAGVVAFGTGTALESVITLFGNSISLTRYWYIAGALCGGYPLAQGSVFLLLQRRTALNLTLVTVPFVLLLSILVAISPVIPDSLQLHRPSGDILGWKWIRALTPIINLYAAGFLVGGAVVSAARYRRSNQPGDGARMTGNSLIAGGALLPGIGGAMAKAGAVEALYVAELAGITLIWFGYLACVRGAPAQIQAAE